MVADQLRISQGWVRCGVCQSVFDASQDLQPLPVEMPEPETWQPVEELPEKQQESVPAQDAGEILNTSVLEAESADQERAEAQLDTCRASENAQMASPSDAQPVAESESLEVAEVLPGLPSASELYPGVAVEQDAAESSLGDQVPPLTADETSLSDPSESVPAEQRVWPLAAESEPDAVMEIGSVDVRRSTDADEPTTLASESQPAAAVIEEKQGAPDNDEPGFVRQARRQAFWHSAGMRVALLLGSLVAVAGVGGQYAWQQRDVLAAQYPALTPVLTKACSLAGCALQARREIADVVISGSGFKQLADARQYQWSLTLENRSDVAVAMPMAELTLTDTQDKPLLRRVIDLKPLGAPEQLQARQEWSVSVPVQLQELDAPVAGYRALVFYP